MTAAQVFGHGRIYYNSILNLCQIVFGNVTTKLACTFTYILYCNCNKWWWFISNMHLFVYLQISCFASTDFLLHSCIKENTQESTKWQRGVLSVHACAFSSEALNDEYRKWHPMKIMVTDPQVRSFEGRWPLSTSRRVHKKWWKAWRAMKSLRIKLGNFQDRQEEISQTPSDMLCSPSIVLFCYVFLYYFVRPTAFPVCSVRAWRWNHEDSDGSVPDRKFR